VEPEDQPGEGLRSDSASFAAEISLRSRAVTVWVDRPVRRLGMGFGTHKLHL
jgi:hypothetical protein